MRKFIFILFSFFFTVPVFSQTNDSICPNGKLKMKIPFNNGLENGTAYEYAQDSRIIQIITYKKGYFKTYDEEGNLVSTEKYVNGEKKKRAEVLSQLEVRTDYYPDGKIKVQATYNKKGLPEGIRREYMVLCFMKKKLLIIYPTAS